MASSRGESTITSLLHAAWSGKLEPLKKLAAELDCGEGLAETFARLKDSKGRTALHMAAVGGKTHVCKYLIEQLKLDVNMKDGNGDSPLHHATIGQHYPTTLYLIEKGANPTLANDKDRCTPLHYAAESGRKEFVRLLIARGAEVDAKADPGTPLHCAAAYGKKDTLVVLLQNKANPNAVARPFFTPLISSIISKSFTCTELLLRAGADPNFESHGVTPLGYAASEGETEVIRYLLKYGANANITNSYGLTPLEIAAINGNHEGTMVLFPVTARVPCIQEWTFGGILKHVHSEEAKHQRELKRKEHFLSSKSKGEASFKKKDYLEAIFWYTEAIDADPTDAAVLSNRSLCWARMKEGGRALSDAEACIMLKPDWPKAHYRAGVAWNLLGNYFRAADEFADALKLDSENKELQAALREAVEAEFGVEVNKGLKVVHF